MEVKHITESNRHAWNEATAKHQAARTIDYKAEFARPGYSTFDEILTLKLNQIGLAGKSVAQLCCNNGRELLSVLNLGASHGTGFDISDAAITEANEYKQISGLNADFVRTDIYDIGHEYHNRYDLVLFTIGGLCWLPDLDRIFEIVAALLKQNGDLLIYDQHPLTYMLAAEDEPEYDPNEPLRPVISYFRTDPWVNTKGLDYVGMTKYASSPSFSCTQKLSDTINAIASNGLNINELREYPHDIGGLFPHLQGAGIFPLSYILWALKPGI